MSLEEVAVWTPSSTTLLVHQVGLGIEGLWVCSVLLGLSLFSYRQGGVEMNILVYVDDLIISGNDGGAVQIFKNYLSTCFHMKDLGALNFFWGSRWPVIRKAYFYANENMLWI